MSVKLLYGEETYLLETRLKKIKKEFGELIQGINYIQIDETNVKELISDIETPAFGYEKKFIIAKNTGLFSKEKKTAKGQELALINLSKKIAEYITENIDLINEAVELVFVEETAEKNTLYKTIDKLGEVKEFSVLKLPEAMQNIQKLCMAYKVKIDNMSARYFVECVGTNMQDLINEIRKLIEYVGQNGVITKNEIDLLTIKQIRSLLKLCYSPSF